MNDAIRKAPIPDHSRPILLALIPCVLMGLRRAGAGLAQTMEPAAAQGAAGVVGGVAADLFRGALAFAPILAASLVAAWTWPRLMARGRKGPPILATIVMALLFALCLAPKTPWSAAALGMSFGVVVGRELFGGRGFVSPAVLGAVFVELSHPGAVSSGWHPAVSAENVTQVGSGWWQLFLQGGGGGPIAEGSAAACLLGGAYLIVKGLIPWRVVVAVVVGAMLGALLAGDRAGSMALAWAWHPISGGLLFGAVFLATDPSVLATTTAGRWLQGLLTGSLIVLLRVAHERHPEGTIPALLLAAVLTPLVDQAVRVAAAAFRGRSHA